MKQNLYSPGTNIKIVDFEIGLKLNPDAIFIGYLNFKDKLLKNVNQLVIKILLFLFPNT